MTDLRAQIDELIEESYYLGLADDDIRTDVLQFVEACHQAVLKHCKDKKTMGILSGELKELRAAVLSDVEKVSGGGDFDTPRETNDETPHERLARRAAQTKLMVIDTIRTRDGRLANLVTKWQSANQGQVSSGSLSWWSRGGRETAVRMLYALLVVAATILAVTRLSNPW